MEAHERIILSLDGFSTLWKAREVAESLDTVGLTVKINDLLDEYGSRAVEFFKEKGFRVFADPKIFDIPTTAARRIARWRDAGADFVTVHAMGGVPMMQAAVEAAGRTTKVLAVTVLTSVGSGDSRCIPKDIAWKDAIANAVTDLASDAREARVHGIVSSPQELKVLAWMRENDFCPPILVTPGVRLERITKDDQKRVATPAEAIANGADYLVIGRPILAPSSGIGTPRTAFWRIVEDIKSVLPVPV